MRLGGRRKGGGGRFGKTRCATSAVSVVHMYLLLDTIQFWEGQAVLDKGLSDEWRIICTTISVYT